MRNTILIATMIATTKIFAADVAPVPSPDVSSITTGQPAFAGTGCPAGELRIDRVSGRDSDDLVLTYNKMEMEAGANSFARLNCSLRLPVKIPVGHQLVLKAVTEGIYNTDKGDQLSLTQRLGFVGAEKSAVLKLQSAWDYLLTDELEAASACSTGKDLMLTSSLTALLTQAKPYSESLLWVDRTVIQMELVPCQ